MKLKLCVNDYAAILATLLTVGTTSVFLASAFAAGLGVHMKDVPPKELGIHLRLFPPAQILWAAANTCVKISIVDLYTRIFPNPAFRRTCYFTMALTICYFVTVLLEAFLMCRPVAYNWNKTIEGSCANLNLAYLLAGITNLLIDALVVIIPMPLLWGLQLPLSKKLGLAGMFGLGSLICVISLLRIIWLKNWDLTDFTYTATPGACWSLLEPALGVVNACLPTIRPVLRKVFNKDMLAWSGANRKRSSIDRVWKQNRPEPSSYPRDSDKNSFLRLEDLQTPSTKPQVRASHVVATDNNMRPSLVKPDSKGIQVTRTWDFETIEDGNHYV
ncbi:hypothetical protein MMC07_005610 [Pseudocyphellaria aurata]|nr:hypothetical protein [Pseudocyphellaria aurata]